MRLLFFFFLCWSVLLFFLIYFLTLQYCIGFAIYQHESATGIHVFILNNSLLACLIFLYTASLIVCLVQASQVVLVVKNSPGNAGDIRVAGSIPGLGRHPGWGHANPLQYSCLENSMDRRAWQTTVHRVTKSWTLLKRLSMHALSLVQEFEWG